MQLCQQHLQQVPGRAPRLRALKGPSSDVVLLNGMYATLFSMALKVSLICAGVAALKSRRAIANAYDAMTLEAYLRSCGCSASYSIKCSDTCIDEYWTIS